MLSMLRVVMSVSGAAILVLAVAMVSFVVIQEGYATDTY